MGRFDNLPLFYLGPNILVIKKISIFLRNQWKVANYTGCQNKLLSSIQRIFEGPSRKTEGTLSNQF